jgi:DNA-binding LytR/AlgR family response regulator
VRLNGYYQISSLCFIKSIELILSNSIKTFCELVRQDLKKVLIINGKLEQEFEFQSVLESSGFSTYLTTGESDGLNIAERYLPDIVICNLGDHEKEISFIKKLNANPSTECIPLIVITSANGHSYYRVAMELGADDIMVKPINEGSLLRSINRRLRKIDVMKTNLTDKIISAENLSSNGSKKIDHILVKIGTKLKLIEFSKIVCITALREYSKITTDDGYKIVVRKSIRNWVETLPAKDFLRIHRATIVNMLFLDKIEKSGFRSYNVYLKNISTPFPISQRYGNIMRKTFSV